VRRLTRIFQYHPFSLFTIPFHYLFQESVVAALECGRGVYYSRSRNGLWRKGDTSGHYQTLHRLDVDCDGDALRFTVTQRGDGDNDTAAFCHLNTLTCWGEPRGLRHLEDTLKERLKSAPEGSYTKRLFDDSELLRDKLVEEAQELAEATEPKDVAGELADVLYFAMARAAKAGVSIDDAVAELDRRTRKVTRRQGDSKAFRIAAGKEILGNNKAV
jgi:phosphoribosyl-ATP pyrophosphohydrolase/phosphoribosyl-AMP cyclohydrolase/histidinol dehydrogenase